MWPTILIIIGIVAIIAIAIALYNWGMSDPEVFLGLFSFLDCCSALGVFGVTIVSMTVAFLFWHSLLVAALVGGSVMTMLFLAVSIAAASNRPGRQSS